MRDAEVAALSAHPGSRAVTPDRGKEHAPLAEVACGVEFFFVLPHYPWRSGTNESTYGLVRDYSPKGASFGTVYDGDVAAVCDVINMRPR